MPLPEKNTPWPPISPIVRRDMEDWSAWLSANPDRLSYQYRTRSTLTYSSGQSNLVRNRPSQYRGGVVGAVARFFWGEPTPLGEKRANLHLPLARDIARTSSDLLYSEPPVLKVENAATQARLEDLMDASLKRTLIAAGEMGSGLGGAYLRIVWDTAISDRPWITRVDADGAAPEFAYGDRLKAVTFWTVIEEDGQRIVRHLERYEPGLVLHGVYEGTPDTLGKKRALGDFPQTADFEPALVLPRGMEKRLLAAYLPNTMDAPDWRDIPGAAGLGTSDFQGQETFLSAIDETYTSLMRDVRLARSRILVPAGYLDSNGPGGGVQWQDREVFSPLNIPPTAEGQGITLNQFAIRTEQHLGTIGDLVARVVRSAGYSGASFGDDTSGAAITATEIKARAARSMSTRARKGELSTPGISDITETLLMLEASELFRSDVEPERPNVVFQDSVQDDIKTLAETATLIRQAEAGSTEVLVALLHPEWDEQDQKAEVRRIQKESGRLVEDPVLLGADRPAPEEPEPAAPDGEDDATEE
ncbi:phage portal protein [Streptomyces sp. NPDC056549]|uniref:phage portal protein n=1 Tax=Streptomyces sp. NPDC056549 TaxID=3345864 RepID=UPI003697FB52